MKNIEDTIENKALKKNESHSRVSMNEEAKFFRSLAVYYLLTIIVFFLHLLLISQKIMVSEWIIGSLDLLMFLGIIGIYIYYKRIASSNKYQITFLIDMWGGTILIIQLFWVFISRLGKVPLIALQQLSLWSLLIGIIICMFSSALFLKSKLLKILTILFGLLSLLNVIIPDIVLEMPDNMSLTSPGSTVYSKFTIMIVCFCLYLYLGKVDLKHDSRGY